MARGTDRAMGLSIAGMGAALIAASFVVWARARIAGTTYNGVSGSVTWSFPGLGKPDATVIYSSDVVTENLKGIDASSMIHNTNPGWISLLIGIAALIAGAAYLWLSRRQITAITVALLGGIVGLICVSYLIDLRSAFGDPPSLVDLKFSPGFGLISTCALSFGLTGLGITAFFLATRRKRSDQLRY